MIKHNVSASENIVGKFSGSEKSPSALVQIYAVILLFIFQLFLVVDVPSI